MTYFVKSAICQSSYDQSSTSNLYKNTFAIILHILVH